MSASLLDSLTGLITPDLVSKAASTYGESDSAIRKGVGAAFPVLLSGLANRAGDSGFVSSLFDLVRSPTNDGSILKDAASLISAGSSSSMMGLGGKLLSLLFGGNTSTVAGSLGEYANIKSSTASTLLGVAAPLVLGLLGKRARADGLNASSLASLLLGQKDSFAAALPGPLANIGRFFGGPARERELQAAPAVIERKKPMPWLVPLLAGIAGLVLVWALFARKDRPVEETAPPATAERAPSPQPDATRLAVATPKATVYFEVDQSVLPAGADGSLASVIAYLQANPGSVAVISGYHDPTGDQAANEELARNRAATVRAALVAAGIEEARIDMLKPVVTEGGGSLEEARRVEVFVR